MKFRKKPVIIEAEQYRVAKHELGEILSRAMCDCFQARCTVSPWHVHTMHNDQAVALEDGDWIIPEPDGIHFYPVKPSVFDQTYEAVS